MTTASTPDEVKTPGSTSLTGFHFHIDDSPVAGPVGPHLFRLSGDSSEGKPFPKIEPSSPEMQVPYDIAASKPLPAHVENGASDEVQLDAPQLDISSWSPHAVVMWLQQLGFDDEVIEKFFINDISGSILLELQSEDLKELDIKSFGKRHRLLGSIRHLRGDSMGSISSDSQLSAGTETSETTSTKKIHAGSAEGSCIGSPVSEVKLDTKSKKDRKNRRRHRRHQVVVPEDSPSIVAIEQMLPKLHTCSKGENCPKWRKQQAKLAKLAKYQQMESFGGSIILTGDPSNATNAQQPLVTPSVVASSDALGPNRPEVKHLSEDTLNDVQPQDPQENVRKFLDFQRLSHLKPATDPVTPPTENFSFKSKTAASSTKKVNLTENLRHLPRLQIPNSHDSERSSLSPDNSALRTVTPSILRKKQAFTQGPTQKPPVSHETISSPSDFYRADPHYGQTTPWSEVDIPVLDIPPFGPVARGASQSVPPNMRFGEHAHQPNDPISRPASTKATNHRRKPSLQTNLNSRPLGRLDERDMLTPIDTPEDLETTPRAAHCRKNPFSQSPTDDNAIIHSGWMKKRKTKRLLRHEWEDRHCTLRGTQLAMSTEEEASQRNSKALEYIDVDDYAVACSSIATQSKLTAAFKKTVLNRKNDARGETAFAFSLIPATQGSTGPDRKTLFLNGPKSHHFTVNDRDDRISWMRGFMIAKTVRKAQKNGASINVNGAVL